MGLKIIDFHPSHIDLMELREQEKNNVCFRKDYKERFGFLSKQGVSGSFIYKGRILCVMGVFDFWKGCAEVWLLPSLAAQEHKIVFARAVKNQLNNLIECANYKRIQANALNDEFHNKFFKWLGFELETENGMKNYTIDGSCYNLWSITRS